MENDKTKTVNRKAFFASIREKAPFNGKMLQSAVVGIEAIIDAFQERIGLTSDNVSHLAYCLATAHGEVGYRLKPVREGFAKTDEAAVRHVERMYQHGLISHNYAEKDAAGLSYFGRGFVQLTHKRNYVTLGNRLGIPLAQYPNLALDLKVAAEILVVGAEFGLFTGVKLGDYLPRHPREARRVINGLDRAGKFERLYRSYLAALEPALRSAYLPLWKRALAPLFPKKETDA